MIDNGAALDHTLTIMPMQEGGFCVFMGDPLHWDDRITRDRCADNGKRWAFSTAADLMAWLQKHADAKMGGGKTTKKVDYMDSVRQSVSS